MSSKTVERARGLRELAEQDPQRVVSSQREIGGFLTSPDQEVRQEAIRTAALLSNNCPFDAQPLIDDVLIRLDDTDPNVRVNANLSLFALAQWYPRNVAKGIPQILVGVNSGLDQESETAVAVLIELARQRPDLFSPKEREECLAAFAEQAEEGFSTELIFIEEDEIWEAEHTLRGGELSGRPMEADLPGGPAEQKATLPARLASVAVSWPLIAFGVIVGACITLLRLLFREEHERKRVDPKLLWSLTEPDRARLYLRQSLIPTPATAFPWLEAERVIKKSDSRVQYPQEWGLIQDRVARRDEHTCRCCGAEITIEADIEGACDFRKPLTEGGALHSRNIRTLCEYCYRIRHGEL